MKGSKFERIGIQTNLFDEPTLSMGGLSLTSSQRVPEPPEADGRSTAVWRQWLSSMASDAEAALAAAIAYREMDSTGRERWLASLELDAPAVNVPAVALYAPLLAVENDPERRERLVCALGQALAAHEESSPEPSPGVPSQALSGVAADGTRVYVVATPLYLNFCQVLACGVRAGAFHWVRHDPIVGSEGVPKVGDELKGARLGQAGMKTVLDQLALVVLSHQRSGKPLPEALSILGDLLGPLSP